MRAAALVMVAVLVAGLVRLGVAVHQIAPRAGLGDLLALVNPSDAPAGSVADEIAHDRRVNVLLLAHGGAGGDNPDYTDTIIVLSIRPATHAATEVALPRYLWVTIPAGARGDVQGKLYVVYALAAGEDQGFLKPQWRGATGPGDLVTATVAATIGQPIPFWIAVDTDAFAALLDAVGGIRIDVPQPLDDPAYPVSDEGRTIHIHFDAGPQTFDGARALEYARSRLSTSDADRSRRQELVLTAMLQSLRSPHWSAAALGSLGALQNGVRTNLEPVDMRALAQLVGGVRQQDVVRMTLDDSGLLESQPLGPAEIEVPRDGTFAAVRDYVAARLP